MANFAKSRKNKKHEDSMLCVKDMEDLAIELRNVRKIKEDLETKIELKQAEVNLWMDILDVSTGTQIEECISDSTLTNLIPITSEKQEMYAKHNELDGVLSTYRFSGIIAKLISNGHVMVEFLPTKNSTFPEKLLLELSQNEDTTFSVVQHNLVDFVPVDELVEEYLSEPHGNIKSFITHVAMYTSQMIKRHNLFESVKNDVLPSVHYNADRTKLCIMLGLEQGVDTVTYELILHYHPLNILPHKVIANHFDGVRPNEDIKELVQSLQEQLYEEQVNSVLYENLTEQSLDSVNAQKAADSIEGSEFSNILG